eukprot:TRINITY_DN17557_c0_g1_i1.p1 TRINITY_DN17557_c0_g1~~TRINITY_DN17557_c0_g1_i1.p1  ORF type:complete len:560 (+),score=117.50 TRINITY_DN17557_c0_g1_i1:167-1846(+)
MTRLRLPLQLALLLPLLWEAAAAGRGARQPRPVTLPLYRSHGRLASAAVRVPDDVGQGWHASARTRRKRRLAHLPRQQGELPHPTRLWTARLWTEGDRQPHPEHIEVTMLDVLLYTNITLGTGASALEPMRVQVDTGSSSLAVPAAECTNCRRRCSACAYDSSLSRTARVVRCETLVCHAAHVAHSSDCWSPSGGCAFILSYADGSEARGDIVQDTVSIGGLSAEGVTFARIWRESPPGGFTNLEVDGILGLAGRDLNMGGALEETVPSALLRSAGLPPLFSISVGFQGKPGSGALTLGGVDEARLQGAPVQWTPLLPGGWYVVQLNCMTLGGTVISSDPEDFGDLTIVDSGTTMTLLPYAVMQRIKRVLLSDWGHLPHVTAPHPYSIFDAGQCFSDIDPSAFPSLTYTFAGGAAVTVTPENYFSTAFQDGMVFYCFGITGGDLPTQWRVAPTQTILGDTFMSATHIIFDRDNARVGFAGAQVMGLPPGGVCAAPVSPPWQRAISALSPNLPAAALIAVAAGVGYLLCDRLHLSCWPVQRRAEPAEKGDRARGAAYSTW